MSSARVMKDRHKMYEKDLIKEHPFFKDLSPQYLEILVNCASEVSYPPGSYLLREGDQADQFFLLRHGEVVIQAARPGEGARTIQTLHAGEVVGWSWLFPPYRYHYSVRSTSLVRALAMDGRCLRGHCEANHGLGYEIMKRFALIMMERLQATRMQILDVYST